MAAAGLRGGALHARLGRAPLLEWVRVGAELSDGEVLLPGQLQRGGASDNAPLRLDDA